MATQNSKFVSESEPVFSFDEDGAVMDALAPLKDRLESFFADEEETDG